MHQLDTIHTQALRQFRAEDVTTMTRTARKAGAVSAKAIVPGIVLDYVVRQNTKPEAPLVSRVLDFGCGAAQVHTKALDAELTRCGMVWVRVAGYDLSLPGTECHLSESWDVVYLSNVLNVQPSLHALGLTCALLHQIKAINPDCLILANYPQTPRKLLLSAQDMESRLWAFGFNAKPWPGKYSCPVWSLEEA